MSSFVSAHLGIPADIPPVKREAWALLRQHGVTVMGIVHVAPDCITYLGASEALMTAWLYGTGRTLLIETEAGIPAEPTAAVSTRHRIPGREDAQPEPST